MAFHPTPTVTLIVLLPLLAWRLRSRYRRLVGRQRLGRYRPWIGMGIYTLLAALLLWAIWGQLPALAAMAGGAAAGGLLSRWAWRQTALEATPQGLFYTPYTWLGIGLSLLFLARIAYRVVEVVWWLPASQSGLHALVVSPLTLAVFGLMAGHNVGYAIALLRWRQRVLATRRTRLAATASPQDEAPPPP